MLSSEEGLSSLQQLLPEGSGETVEFSEALLQKIEQLQALNFTDGSSESLIMDSLESGNSLQDIADSINENNTAIVFGKGLPQENNQEQVLAAVESHVNPVIPELNIQRQSALLNKREQIVDVEMDNVSDFQEHKLEDGIDLETTLDALKNVLNTLDEDVQDGEALVTQLDEAIENIKAINIETSEQLELNHKLDKVVETLEGLKKQDSVTELSNQLGINQSQKQTAYSINEKELISSLDEIMDDVQQLEELALNGSDLESQIAQVSIDIGSIKESISKKIPVQLSLQEQQINNSLEVEDQIASEVDIDNQIATLVASLSESKVPGKEAVVADYQYVRTGLNKENISLKQHSEESLLSFPNKPELDSEITLPLKNSATKSSQNEMGILSMTKQTERVNVSEGMDVELNTERVLPKFATDIANLNRAVMTETKAEISPMTKHFAHPEWNKEMGERVIWMHKQAIPSAELRLNPGHLGPVTIKVDVTQDQVSVAFTAHHAAVKEAIDATLPKLREMFSAQQLNLGDVSVSQEDTGQKQSRGFSQMGSDAGKGGQHKNETAENEQTEGVMDIADEIEAGRAIASHGVLSLFA